MRAPSDTGPHPNGLAGTAAGAGTREVLAAFGIGLAASAGPASGAEVVHRDGSTSEYGLEIRKASDTSFTLLYEDGTRIGVDTGRKTLRIGPGEDPDAPILRHNLLDDAAPRLLSHTGTWCFHMGGVRIGSRTAAFTGPSGTGKSTLVAALTQSGASLLSDDALILDPVPSPPSVGGLYPSLRLWPDSLSRLPGLRRLPSAAAGPEGKVAVHSARSLATAQALHRVYVLDRADGATGPGAERLSPGAGTFALIECAFGLDVTDTAWRTRLLSVAATICGSVPVFRLSFPASLDELHRTVMFLERHGDDAGA